MVRRKRESFLEKKLYSRFGYYPWVCQICKQRVLLKARGERRKKKRTPESDQQYRRDHPGNPRP
jgi:hypothetical protein